MIQRLSPLVLVTVVILSACGSSPATTQPTVTSATISSSPTALAPTSIATPTATTAPTIPAATAMPAVTITPPAASNVSPDPVLTIATTLLPAAPSNPVTGYASYGEGERLLYPVPGGEPRPWLATSVTMVDPKSWQITLREGVKFQNGTLMTATKVASWLANEFQNDYDPGIYTDAVVGTNGDQGVTVTFATPQPGFAFDLAYFSLPVYDLEALKAVGEDYNKLAGLGIFTGPYMLSEITPTRWTYARNPNYWAGAPALESIVKVGVNDEQAGIRAVQNGEADILELVTPKMKPTVEAIKGLHFVTGDPALQPEFVALRPNLGKAPWNDPVVRKALELTIDSEDISAKSSFGVFTTIHGIFPPNSQFGIDWVRPNLDEANRLLDKAGWMPGADGVRAKGGVRLSGELITSEDVLNDVSVVVAENAKRVGFDLKPSLGEAQAVYDQVNTKGSFDIAMIYGQNMGYDGDLTAFCDMFDPNYSYGGTSSVKDTVIRSSCDEFLKSRDPKVVAQVLHDVQQRNIDQDFVIPVVGFIPASVTNDAWSDYRPNYFFDMIGWQTKSK